MLRMHSAGVELAESVFSSDDTGTFTPYKPRVVMGVRRPKKSASRRLRSRRRRLLSIDLACSRPD